MKCIKYLKYMVLMACIFGMNTFKVDAANNYPNVGRGEVGQYSPQKNTGSASTCPYKPGSPARWCIFDRNNTIGIRITVVYYDKATGKYEDLSEPYDIWYQKYDMRWWSENRLYRLAGQPFSKFCTYKSSKASAGGVDYNSPICGGYNAIYVNELREIYGLESDWNFSGFYDFYANVETYYPGGDKVKLLQYKDLSKVFTPEVWSKLLEPGKSIFGDINSEYLKNTYGTITGDSEKCEKGQYDECYGVRMYVEPLMVAMNTKTGDWVVLTPSEIGNSYVQAPNDDFLKLTFMNLYGVTAYSMLHLGFPDMGMSAPQNFNDLIVNCDNGDCNTVGEYDYYNYRARMMRLLSDRKQGYGLNMFDIDPLIKVEQNTCEIIEENYSGFLQENYKKLNKDLVLYKDEKNHLSYTVEWYIDACTCDGLPNLYNDNKTDDEKELSEMTKSELTAKFGTGTAFIDKYKTWLNEKYDNMYNTTTPQGFAHMEPVPKYKDFEQFINECANSIDFKKESATCEEVGQRYNGKDTGNKVIMTKDGINYTADWYINACTCKGLDNYYISVTKGNSLLKIKNKNLLINAFQQRFENNNLKGYISWLENRYKSIYENNGLFVITDWMPKTADEFIEVCGNVLDEDITKTDCTPEFTFGKYNQNGARYATCYTGLSSYKESTEWEDCIFNDNGYYGIDTHKTSANSGLTYYDKALSKEYCEVYCTEEFDSVASSTGPSAIAGQHFIWPNGSSYLRGSRTCKTKEVKWKEFTDDLDAANENARDKYALYRLAEKRYDSVRQRTTSNPIGYTVVKDSCDYYCDENDHFDCCAEGAAYDSYSCGCGDETYNCSCGDAVTCGKDDKDCTPKSDSMSCGCNDETYNCSCGIDSCRRYVEPYDHGDLYLPNGEDEYTPTISIKGKDNIVDGKNEISEITIGSWCSSNGSGDENTSPHYIYKRNGRLITITTTEKDLEKEKDYARSKYEEALKNPNGYYNTMVSCYDKWSIGKSTEGDDLYNVNPNATMIYKGNGAGGNVYEYSGEVQAKTRYSQAIVDISGCKDTKVWVVTDYTDDGPILEYRKIKDCSNGKGVVTMKRTATTTFTLNSGVYRYVNKLNGMSFHADELSRYNVGNFNYIDVGEGNLPVSYGTQPGLYGSGTSNGGELSMTYDNVGHIVDDSSAIQNIISTTAPQFGEPNYNIISCNYTVVGGHIVERGGLTVVYRPIDLYDPFPSIDANGRFTGANWCDGWSCKNDNDVVKEVILNNRDVVGDEVYNLEPMYSFTLTPRIINYIRTYNDGNAYDNETLDCDDETGGRCISDFLTKILIETNATGTCADHVDTTRKDNFNTCRYKK